MSLNITFFKTKNHEYLYDGNTGGIFRITPLIKRILSDYPEKDEFEVKAVLEKDYAIEELDEAFVRIAVAREGGLLTEKPKEIYEEMLIRQLPFTLDNTINKVCLSVTQQCNLRCEYCAYSGIYGEGHRQHSERSMSFETAKKVIDLSLARSTKGDEFTLSFYGGEPLIRFDFIQQCIDYVKREYPGKKLMFNITTNGTLLTEEKLEYLVENQVRIYISIDGPEEYHDEYRKYMNHRGSFADIKANLLRLKEKYPDYYHEWVNFGVTISPFRKLEKIEDFLAKDEMFYEDGYVRISSVNPDYDVDIYANRNSEENIRELAIEKSFMHLRYLVSKVRGEKDYLHKTRVTETFCGSIDITKRMKTVAAEKILPGGPCIPGDHLYVTTEGEFIICEKANEQGCLKMGNVDEGLNLEQAQKILKDFYALTKEECLNCWAYLHCSICPAQIERNGEQSRVEKLKICKFVKQNMLRELTLYMAILEKNPVAFGVI